MVEAPMALAALWLLNVVVWPEDPGFRNAEIQPYFFVVIFLAIRYGTAPGFYTGLLSAGLYVMLLVRGREVPVGPEWFESGLLWTPLLLILTGVLVGEFVQVLRARVAFYRERTGTLEKDLAEAHRRVRELQGAKEDRDAPGAGGRPSGRTLFEQVRKMRSMPREEIHDFFLDLLVHHFGMGAAAVYERGPEGLSLKSRRSLVACPRVPEKLREDRGLAGLALERGRIVTALEMQDEAPGPFLLCAPLKTRNRVLGVVGILQISVSSVSPGFFRKLWALVEWTAGSLAADPREGGALNGVVEQAYLVFCLSDVLERAPNGMPRFGLMGFRIPGYEELPAGRRKAEREGLGRILLGAVRSADFVAETEREGEFAVYLEAPGEHGCAAVIDRVRRLWGEASRRGEVTPHAVEYSTFVSPPPPESIDQVLSALQTNRVPLKPSGSGS